MTLLSANDRFEILDLCSRYNRFLDNTDEEGIMECWARSGISFEGVKEKISNWEQLKRHFSKELHETHRSPRRSILFNVIVREAEGVDSAYVDAEYLVIDTQDLQVIETGSYTSDRVIRTSMGWRFSRRTQKIDAHTSITQKVAKAQETQTPSAH